MRRLTGQLTLHLFRCSLHYIIDGTLVESEGRYRRRRGWFTVEEVVVVRGRKGFQFVMYLSLIDLQILRLCVHTIMPPKHLCLCIPSCMKPIVAQQRQHHRELLKTARVLSSSDLESVPGNRHNELDPDQDLNSFADYDDDVIMQDTIVLDDLRSDAASDSSSLQDKARFFPNLDEVEGLEEEAEVEEVEEEEHDEITDEDLIRVLQERYGEEWKAQLHAIRKYF
jgi:hypothetical protein